MNLFEFERYVSRRIEDRGYSYYMSGNLELVSQTRNTYLFNVNGSIVYRVEVTCANEWMIQSSCDCPYDQGTCKHEVAVYYWLRNRLSPGSPFDLAKELSKLKKAELIDVMLKLVHDPDIHHRLAHDFTPPSSNPKTFVQVCEREIVGKFSNGTIHQQEMKTLKRYLFRKINVIQSDENPISRLFNSISFLDIVTPTIMRCETFIHLLFAVRDEITDLMVSAIEEIPKAERDMVLQRFILIWHELHLAVYHDVHVQLLKGIVPIYEGDKTFLIDQIDRFRNTHAEASDLEHLDEFTKVLTEES
ncbi:SWIM zinc finger domain-containing protein [Exiguobacterium sp. SL-9]|uniref:SWIM zinc finger family protein n=1 Tax=Exiguobacterium sp. SL-9 TaxID=2510963 RepID=UPI001038ACB7|nr:hypothetical protein [Exiguobacterium sp. SL-9]